MVSSIRVSTLKSLLLGKDLIITVFCSITCIKYIYILMAREDGTPVCDCDGGILSISVGNIANGN